MRIIELIRLLESPCECGIEPPGSINHGVSYLGSYLSCYGQIISMFNYTKIENHRMKAN